ncbi:ead/Ea22-like family protein [Pseudescherichia sp.]|uniref:ead/Ea22-like family protein n=1 Tax=Pseudescherichia sp. TaxID=2055881 RepID=UPI0028A71A33|nr:ead/Ea22-like family protein [Pseudescherichia sp.]
MSDKYAALKAAAERAEGAHDRLSVMPPDDIFDISLQQGTQLDNDITDLNNFNDAANPATILELLAERDADKRRIAELEAREVKLPPLSDDLIAILGRPNFTCAHLAELMRKGGDDIRRKAEHEQAAVIYWFLSLYLEHGNKWEAVAKADIQSRVAMASASLKIEGE